MFYVLRRILLSAHGGREESAMPKYQYTAYDESGKTLRGQADALDEKELYRKLKEDSIFIVTAKVVVQRGNLRRLKPKIVVSYCREMGTLLNAGISLVRALHILAQEEEIDPYSRLVFENVQNQIRRGVALSEAMRAQGSAFPELLIQMINAAENSGTIDKTIARMAEFYEKDYRMNQKIGGAMTYPAVLAVLTVAAVMVIVTFVLPQFESMFAMVGELPTPTKIILAISDFMSNYWYLALAAVVLLVFAVKLILRVPLVQLRLDKLKVHVKGFKKMLCTIYTARFARTLSSLYSSGMPILMCLEVGRSTVGNTYIASQFDAVIASVRQGGTLAQAVAMVDGFEKKLASTIFVGEETGNLDTMLNVVSDSMDYESEIAVAKMTTMIEPIMIIFMAAIIGFIMISVMMPIFSMYSGIEGGAT